MVKARHSGADYLFSLLTGYCEPPAGKNIMTGLYYNPYFPGGAIAMPPPLNDGGVEYEDGTPATISQQAKDVVQFLNWCAEPEADERKKFGFQYMTAVAFINIVCAAVAITEIKTETKTLFAVNFFSKVKEYRSII
jgi:ubiquinol-cytochrome c reductase cytochrome c1 subunit